MKKFFAAVLCVLLLGAAVLPVSADNAEGTRLGEGMSVMGFSSYDVVTNETVTSDIIDDVVCTVINEWADWCGPCQAEMPYFQAMHEHYSATPEADVQILGSVYCGQGCTPQTAAAFLTQHGYTWHNLVEDNVLAQVFNTSNYIPQTIIVDRHGVVRYHQEGGFSSAEQLQQLIDSWYQTLLAEEGPNDEVPGDVSGDGVVDANDALLVLRYAMGVSTDLENPEAADVNGDGSVDAVDAVIVLRVALGLIEL